MVLLTRCVAARTAGAVAVLSASVMLSTSLMLSTAVPSSGAATGPAPGIRSDGPTGLVWSDCAGPRGAQCTTLAVSGPDTGSWRIPVIRLPATGERLGVLMANPGGPGISGVAYLRDWGQSLSRLRARYDIVSFDPPGVAGSEPNLACLSTKQQSAIRNQPSAPSTADQRRRADRLARLIGRACEHRLGAALPDVSTLDAAAVMDRLREALGEESIAYLGFSYGTLLGAVYADRYPGRTTRVVLDGAMDPAANYDRVRRDQAVALDRATRRFARDCPRHRNCPLTGDVDTDLRTLRLLVHGLDDRPYRHGSRVLSGLRALNLIQSSMYYPPYGWRVLRRVLGPALRGDLRPMLAAAYSPDNMVDPADPEYLGVVCEDLATSRDPGRIPAMAARWSRLAPLNGASRAWSTAPCATWPARNPALPHRLAAAGSGPVLVIGTRYDPATPVQWARDLAAMLDHGHYLEWKGDGHLGYDGDRGGACVVRTVDRFLLDGVEPPQHRTCPAA